MCQVGRTTGALRRTDSDEVGLRPADRREVGRERQPAGLDSSSQDLGESRFMEGGPSFGEGLDLVPVDVDTDNAVAQLGHGTGVDGSKVTATDDSDIHAVNPSVSRESGMVRGRTGNGCSGRNAAASQSGAGAGT